MGKAVRKDGRYSGVRADGREWPEMLIGAEEIGGYLRMHPRTALRMLKDRLLPAWKDDLGRWITTRRVLDHWMREGMAATLAAWGVGRS